jgi:molecular chaperone GrpE
MTDPVERSESSQDTKNDTDPISPDELAAAGSRIEESASPDDESVAVGDPQTLDEVRLLEENAAFRERLLRLQADFENFRRRTQRERSELYRRANEDLVGELLPALDHFEIGLREAETDEAQRSLVDGFRLIYDQLLSALTKFGLEPLAAAGQPFDPHHHEALTQLPSNDVPADTVLEELRRGYRFGDRLLRAAQVVVSSGPPPTGVAPGATPADLNQEPERS